MPEVFLLDFRFLYFSEQNIQVKVLSSATLEQVIIL